MLQRRTRNKIALFAVPLATALVIGLGALRTPATDGTLTLEASLSTKKLTVRKDGVELNLFTTITTLGTPHDVTVHELRMEAFFPADEATAEWFRKQSA